VESVYRVEDEPDNWAPHCQRHSEARRRCMAGMWAPLAARIGAQAGVEEVGRTEMLGLDPGEKSGLREE
jgi:hypothetical protein